MDKESEFAERMKAQLARLRKDEEYKAFLHDRTIGGESVLRPTPDFIEECVGPMKSDEELRQEATAAAEHEQKQALQAAISNELSRRRTFLEEQRPGDDQQRDIDHDSGFAP